MNVSQKKVNKVLVTLKEREQLNVMKQIRKDQRECFDCCEDAVEPIIVFKLVNLDGSIVKGNRVKLNGNSLGKLALKNVSPSVVEEIYQAYPQAIELTYELKCPHCLEKWD